VIPASSSHGVRDAGPARAEHLQSQRRPDAATSAWLDALRSQGRVRTQAIEDLHALLLRAARFEVSRRSAALPFTSREQLGDLATQAADDALVAILAKLDGFRGDCRFTTWAYKFALLEAGVALRRRAWQGQEVVLDADGWGRMPNATASPQSQAESDELFAVLFDCIATELTPHQRGVLLALAIDGVPIDVLAERLSTTRGALYKTLHDARRKLRSRLSDRGLAPHDRRSSDAQRNTSPIG
jgi:RNA polymerase sigma-70 factor (ECF subfamily)